jgi:hypothetical protein
LADLNCVEDVLRSHLYNYPICENIIRMNDSVSFEHEIRLQDGNWLLIIYRYEFTKGLMVDRIFDRRELNDIMEEYKNHPSVMDIIQLINEEIKSICQH